jgi:Viral BACON domain/Putative binding domain, N-terminal
VTRALPRFCALACALAAASCTSSASSVSVTAPTSAKCQITAASSRAAFGAAGGTGAVTVSADRDCEWGMQPAVTWIAVDGPVSGQGAATVNFRVSANGEPNTRKGAIVVAGSSVEITQDAAPCRYALDRSAASMGADGGSLTVSVATIAGCAWSVAADAAWMSIKTVRDGNGSGSTQIAVAPNSGIGVRTGRVTIADQAVVVSQQGRSSTLPPPSTPSPGSPAPTPPPPAPHPSPTPSPPPGDPGKQDDGGDKDKGKDPKHDEGKDKKGKGGKDKGDDDDQGDDDKGGRDKDKDKGKDVGSRVLTTADEQV